MRKNTPKTLSNPNHNLEAMFGRFTQFSTINSIVRHFHLQEGIDLPPRYNIAPSQQIPSIKYLSDKPFRQLVMMRWGLIPHWARDERIGYKMLNARSETITYKQAFREAFNNRRCLIPSTGFYEWKHEGKRKQPYFIKMKSDEPFAFAGIWETWINPEGEKIESCAIVTTESNTIISKIHTRMPVIIDPENYDLWLYPDTEQEQLLSLLKPYPSDKIHAYPVSSIVNSPKNDTPQCIEQLPLFR